MVPVRRVLLQWTDPIGKLSCAIIGSRCAEASLAMKRDIDKQQRALLLLT